MAADAKKELLELDDPAVVAEAEAATPSGMQPSQQAHPTVIPPFDPVLAAAQREEAPTITNEVELEQARLASMSSQVPPARARVDSLVEVEAGEADLDVLDVSEQIEVLTARLAPLDRVPELVKPAAQLADLLEDPQAAYLAGFVDGLLPLETIVEVAGLPQVDALRILDRMLSQGIAVFRTRQPGI